MNTIRRYKAPNNREKMCITALLSHRIGLTTYVPSAPITTACYGYMTNNERRAVFNTAWGKLFFRRALEFAHNQRFNEEKDKKVLFTKNACLL